MSIRSWFIGVSIVALAGCGAATSGEQAPDGVGAVPPAAAKTVSFAADVKPVLDKNCHDCHLGGGKKGGFNMDTRENAMLPGRNGPRIVEGDGESSSLVQRVAHVPGVKKMPPKGAALSEDDVALLRAWIDQGAKWE